MESAQAQYLFEMGLTGVKPLVAELRRVAVPTSTINIRKTRIVVLKRAGLILVRASRVIIG